MHQPQHGVAGGHIVHQDAQRAQVVQLFNRQRLALHLFPNAVDVLGTAGHIGLDALGLHHGAQLRLDLLDVAFAAHAVVIQRAGDTQIILSLQDAEGEILQLPLQLPDAKTVGQRRMDVAGHLGQCTLLVHRQPPCRAHARKLACQHDRHHPQVAHQRQQQTPHAFRVAPAAMAAVQRPHPARGTLAFQQHVQPFGHFDAGRLRQRLHIDQCIQCRRCQHVGIGIERRQNAEGIGQYIGTVAHGRPGLRLASPEACQRRRQGIGGHTVQRSVVYGSGQRSGGHGNTVAAHA